MYRRTNKLSLLALVVTTLVQPALAAGGPPNPTIANVLSANPDVASSAVESLRAEGPTGLRLLLDAYRADVEQVRQGRPAPPNWERLRIAIDRVAAQRDAYASGLFWYTDLEAAKRAAKASGRPVLSLRLLGRLDEELSCANSRFFRTALYANADVSRYLAEHFILHWSSERPAPKITIDFGDGRKVVRTITGNSVHYILDDRGRVVDALPGLYGPRAFVRALEVAEDEARAESSLDDAARAEQWRRYATAQLSATRREWTAHIAEARKLGQLVIAPDGTVKPVRANALPAMPSATAGRLAISKMAVEVSALRALDLETDPNDRPFDDPIWTAIAAQTPEDAVLDGESTALMRSHVAREALGGDGSMFEIIVASFQRTIGIDTVRNRYMLRPTILNLIATTEMTGELERVNRAVYDEVFRTPRYDPWLGLVPTDAYTAIEDGGMIADDADRE